MKLELELEPKSNESVRASTLRTCRKGTYVFPSYYSPQDMRGIESSFSHTGLDVTHRKTVLFVS